MNKDLLERYFNQILAMTKGDNTSDSDIIDYENGQSISKDEIESEYYKYLDLQSKIDDYIEENDLDDTNQEDIKQVIKQFPETEGFLLWNQACLVDFPNYMSLKIEHMLSNVRVAKMIFSKNGNGFLTTKIAIPVPWVKEMNLTENDRECILEFKDNQIIIKKR